VAQIPFMLAQNLPRDMLGYSFTLCWIIDHLRDKSLFSFQAFTCTGTGDKSQQKNCSKFTHKSK